MTACCVKIPLTACIYMDKKNVNKKSLPRDTNQLNKGAVNSYIVPRSDQEIIMRSWDTAEMHRAEEMIESELRSPTDRPIPPHIWELLIRLEQNHQRQKRYIYTLLHFAAEIKVKLNTQKDEWRIIPRKSVCQNLTLPTRLGNKASRLDVCCLYGHKCLTIVSLN